MPGEDGSARTNVKLEAWSMTYIEARNCTAGTILAKDIAERVGLFVLQHPCWDARNFCTKGLWFGRNVETEGCR